MLTERNLLDAEKDIHAARDRLAVVARALGCVGCIRFSNGAAITFPEDGSTSADDFASINSELRYAGSKDDVMLMELQTEGRHGYVGKYELRCSEGAGELYVMEEASGSEGAAPEKIKDRTRIIAKVARELIETISIMESSSLNESCWHAYMHGISNLVTAVRGAAEILEIDCSHVAFDKNGRVLEEGKEDPEKESILTALYLANIEKCNAINRLYYLKPNLFHGTERPVYSPENPLAPIKRLLAPYVHQARGRRIGIEFDKEGVFAGMPPVRIESHSYQRMFHNIMTNAIKYSYHGLDDERGETERVIKIWGRPKHDPDGKLCYVAVQNYGIGIESDEIGRVCKPGYRGRIARREVEVGAGLGLYDAARVAKLHEGRIGIESYKVNPKTYLTTIKVILPVCEGEK